MNFDIDPYSPVSGGVRDAMLHHSYLHFASIVGKKSDLSSLSSIYFCCQYKPISVAKMEPYKCVSECTFPNSRPLIYLKHIFWHILFFIFKFASYLFALFSRLIFSFSSNLGLPPPYFAGLFLGLTGEDPSALNWSGLSGRWSLASLARALISVHEHVCVCVRVYKCLRPSTSICGVCACALAVDSSCRAKPAFVWTLDESLSSKPFFIIILGRSNRNVFKKKLPQCFNYYKIFHDCCPFCPCNLITITNYDAGIYSAH